LLDGVDVPICLRVLTVSHHIGIEYYPTKTVKNKTVYATIQANELMKLSLASMGVEGLGSGSGALDVMVKGNVKKSIGVNVYGTGKVSEDLDQAFLLYTVSQDT